MADKKKLTEKMKPREAESLGQRCVFAARLLFYQDLLTDREYQSVRNRIDVRTVREASKKTAAREARQ